MCNFCVKGDFSFLLYLPMAKKLRKSVQTHFLLWSFLGHPVCSRDFFSFTHCYSYLSISYFWISRKWKSANISWKFANSYIHTSLRMHPQVSIIGRVGQFKLAGRFLGNTNLVYFHTNYLSVLMYTYMISRCTLHRYQDRQSNPFLPKMRVRCAHNSVPGLLHHRFQKWWEVHQYLTLENGIFNPQSNFCHTDWKWNAMIIECLLSEMLLL